MDVNPRDALAAGRDIATHAIEKAADIVGNAGDIIRGDVAGGSRNIVRNALDIANYAVDRVKEVLAGPNADGE